MYMNHISAEIHTLAVACFLGPASVGAKCRDSHRCVLWFVEDLQIH